MQEAGWLSRLADSEDMRITRLELTPAGRRLFEKIWPTVARLNELALAGISKSDVQLLHRILERMRSNLEDYVGGETHAA